MFIHPIDTLSYNLGQKLQSVDFTDKENDTCDYFDLNAETHWTTSTTDLITMTLNIRGLINKQKDLLKLMNQIAGINKVDIAMLQETWITQSNAQLVDIPGYKHFFIHRS